MNKFYRTLTETISLILFFTSICSAGGSVSILTFTASANFIFADTKAPKIIHQPLERISPITKIAFIIGTAIDENKISSINIYYKKSSEINWSTHTIIPPYHPLVYNFSFQIPRDFITENIQYKIIVTDGVNQTYYPSDRDWITVTIDKKISRNINPVGGIITLPDGNPADGETSIEIPPGAVPETIEITIEELNPDDPLIPDGISPCLTKRPHTVYKFLPPGLAFKKPVKIHLLYLDVNNDSKIDDFDYSETKDISIFWLDKIQKWRVTGGKVDSIQNTVSCYITHFSIFAIFPKSPLSASDYRPKEKIITPFGDNKKIHFDGIAGIETEINIYDIRGRKIKTINSPPYEWDATDNFGEIVESGVYIYQFRAEVDGKLKLINGIVAVAK